MKYLLIGYAALFLFNVVCAVILYIGSGAAIDIFGLFNVLHIF